MTCGIVYLLTSNRLAARFVVSLHSLRQWYDGPVTVFTTRPESHEIGERCAQDAALRIDHRQICERRAAVQTAAYLTKPKAIAESPYEATVFLDADTLIVGDISKLLLSAQRHDITATVFGCWTTTDDHYRELLGKWRRLNISNETLGYSLTELIDRALDAAHPAINIGVFAMRRGSLLLGEWDRLTLAARTMPIPDEVSFQLLLPDYSHALLGMEYNYHPVACPPRDDIRIWHFAGGMHLPNVHSHEVWLAEYDECRRKNVAGINAWSRIDSPR
ncbi:MAG: hypothetical protein R3E01_19420 [Pirellulaceae bacterium]|nr:hypothetical protein [Planctomycetales bacterium]